MVILFCIALNLSMHQVSILIIRNSEFIMKNINLFTITSKGSNDETFNFIKSLVYEIF